MDNSQILEEIKRIKENSIAYKKAYGINGMETKDEIGGHVEYDLSEHEESVCPSDEFMISLFKECAAGLGFQYERR